MSVDIFLELDGVKGESKDPKHPDAIEIRSFAWGMSQSGSAHSGSGAGSGKVSVQDISFTHTVDNASATLVLFCCNGKHIKKGKLIVRKAGEHPLEYLTIELEDVFVSGVIPGGHGSDDQLIENFTLNFAWFKMEYVQQKPDGTGGKRQEAVWNIAAGKGA